MRHTAGFTYGNQGTTALHKAYPGGSGNVAATMTGAEFIDALAKLPLHYQPGTTLGLQLRPRHPRPRHRERREAAARRASCRIASSDRSA